MKSQHVFAWLFAAAVLVPAAANAAAPYAAAPYVELNLGASLPMEHDFKNSLSSDAMISYKNAFGITAAVGYAFGNGVRADFEYGYQKPDFDKVSGTISGTPVVFTGTGGSGVAVHTFTANGYYDFSTGTAFTPFVGAGLGVAYAHAKTDTPTGATTYLTTDSSDAMFAYQATVGASYALTDHLAVTGSYRYLGTTEGTFKTTLVSGATSVSGDAKTSFSSNVLRVGARYSF